MVSENVLYALGVHRTANGAIEMMLEGDPNENRGVRGMESTSIYVLDYTTEYDANYCKSDIGETIKGFGHILTKIWLPYRVVEPPQGRKPASLNIGNCVRYAIDFCHACKIGDRVAFLVVPDDEHAIQTAGFNSTAVNHRVCDVPGLVDNLYYSGLSGALRLLNRLLPNRTMREAEEFHDQLCAALEFRTDLHFKRERNVLAFKNNVALRINVYARDHDDVVQVMPPITPEDHILASGRLPVNYNPTVTDSKLAIEITEGWSDTYKSDKWWRNIELNFSNPLMLDYENKGFVVNIGAGGAGMTAMNKLRKALVGESAIAVGTNGLSGLAKTGDLGTLGNVMAYVVDELPPGPVPAKALAALRTLSTGEEVDNRKYFSQDSEKIGHFAVIVNSNHFPEIPQREARRNSMVRRFHVCQHYKIFDDASVHNTADREARPDKIAEFLSDEDALSCLLNWALEGIARVIVNRGYTYDAADIAYRDRNLGQQDTISAFFEELGGIYGENWGSPRLYHFGYNDEMILYPCWYDCKKAIPLSKVMDMTTEHACNGQILVDNSNYRLRMVNETGTLYSLYSDYCKDAGSTAVLNRKNFKVELLNTGYDEIRVVDPFGRRAQLIVPAGTDNSAAGFSAFLQSQRDAFASRDDDTEALPTTTAPTTLSSEISNIIDSGKSRWSDVSEMAHDAGEAGKPQIVSKWLHAFEGKTIDDIVAGDIGIDVDHEALMAVLRVGIRAVQTEYGFTERGVFNG